MGVKTILEFVLEFVYSLVPKKLMKLMDPPFPCHTGSHAPPLHNNQHWHQSAAGAQQGVVVSSFAIYIH